MCERIIDYLPVTHPQLRTWPANQTCALTGNRTGNLLVYRLVLSPLSYSSQGSPFLFIRIVFVVIDWMISLYISDISSLSEALFLNIFSHLVGWRFVYRWFLLLCRSFLVWCSSIRLFFSFVSLASEVNFTKSFEIKVGKLSVCFLLCISWFRVLYSSLRCS